MNSTRAWKDPEYRRELGIDAQDNPAGLVDLSDDTIEQVNGGSSSWACITATIALTATICSPTGTACGSCSMGTNGCCH